MGYHKDLAAVQEASPETPFSGALKQSTETKTMTPAVTTNQMSQTGEIPVHDSPADTISASRHRIANLEGKSCPETQPMTMNTSSAVEAAEKADLGTNPTREAP